jgi:hypothetical protein
VSDQALYAVFGACAAVFGMLGLVFLRYFMVQGERLFVFFAAAFWCFAAGMVVRVVISFEEHGPYIFVPRLVGFLLIICGIIEKNRRARSSSP